MKVMKKLNEREIIKILRNGKFIPDDVETFHLGKQLCAANVDTLVESTDIPPDSDLSNIARKSVVSGVSDFAAKGMILSEIWAYILNNSQSKTTGFC